MSRINRVPLGLLDFLSSKTLGDNPSELRSDVQPTLELSGFYAAERLTIRAEVTTVDAATAFVNDVTVPQGEIWLISGLSLELLFAGVAGQTSLLEIWVESPPGGTIGDGGRFSVAGSELVTSKLNAEPFWIRHYPAEPLVLGTGATISFRERINGRTNATTNFNSQILYNPYTV